MITFIEKPNLSSDSERILERLSSHGWKVSWAIDPDLAGYAASNMDEQQILFRDQASLADHETILHELLHFDLYDKGYPSIKAKSYWDQSSIYVLNDVFQHIMMKPEMERAGFSMGTQEVPATLRLMKKLEEHPPSNEAFWAALYMRGHFLEIDSSKLELLEKYIRENQSIITMNKITKAINQLPHQNSSIEEYTQSLNEVLDILSLKNEVVIYKK